MNLAEWAVSKEVDKAKLVISELIQSEIDRHIEISERESRYGRMCILALSMINTGTLYFSILS